METTSSIKYSVRKELDEDSYIKVDIRLNDECRNGFEEFAITGSYRNKTDAISGSIHDKIIEHFPEFKIFIDLHLSDHKGMPMYAVANGFYFLENGKKKVLMEHLRISEEECDKIAGMTVNMKHFSYLIQKMGLPERWKQEADNAIKMLEELTGKKFESRATKPRKFDEFSAIEIQEFENMVYNGYYSFENFNKKEEEKRIKEKENLLEELKRDMEKKVIPVQEEYAVKKHLVELDIPINNFIYYTHSREGRFNWMENSYDKMITEEEFKEIMSKIDMSKLPNGVKFTCKKFRR